MNKKRAEYVALQGSEEEKQDFLHWLDYSIGYATARFDFFALAYYQGVRDYYLSLLQSNC
ncbi:MAG: hypothetical protein E7350_04645 [Clostridiales bacterium]|nr:hypothetical protein [Clostridiales bacterium]